MIPSFVHVILFLDSIKRVPSMFFKNSIALVWGHRFFIDWNFGNFLTLSKKSTTTKKKQCMLKVVTCIVSCNCVKVVLCNQINHDYLKYSRLHTQRLSTENLHFMVLLAVLKLVYIFNSLTKSVVFLTFS